jgi:hypothetical protein
MVSPTHRQPAQPQQNETKKLSLFHLATKADLHDLEQRLTQRLTLEIERTAHRAARDVIGVVVGLATMFGVLIGVFQFLPHVTR